MPRFGIALHQVVRTAAVVALATVVASCFDWNRSTSVEINDVRLFISDVQTLSGRSATLRIGVPAANAGGPTLTAVVPEIVLKGGAAQVPFSSTEPFSRVVIAAEGVPGYWDLQLDGPTTLAELVVVYAQQPGAPAFGMRYAGADGGGVGAIAQGNTSFLGNGTGPVQVNITWNSPADVDLYVVDPHGDELFYATRRVASGGQLDIDSNAACFSDGPRAENIFWPFGVVPPKGEYTVRVNYWSSCGVPFTDYVVTVRVGDASPTMYRGRLTGQGGLPSTNCREDPCVVGGEGAGFRITSFVY